jgi:hypothetical protein
MPVNAVRGRSVSFATSHPKPANAQEDRMPRFADNPVHFAADCSRHGGRCAIGRENFLFLDDGQEIAAIDQLQNKCGYVVFVPDPSDRRRAWLYHTSCPRMSDVVEQIFSGCLTASESVPQRTSEMSVGETLRRRLTLSYTDCLARVNRFAFEDAA